jgi:DNA-binding NarL/FixJ family response regulator
MNNASVRQLVVSCQNIQLGSFIAQLYSQKGFKTYDFSDNYQDLPAFVQKTNPDYLFISSGLLQATDGIEICRQIKSTPQLATKCIVLFPPNFKGLFAALYADISAYLYNDAKLDEIEWAIQRINSGERYITPKMLEKLRTNQIPDYQNLIAPLTHREREIFRYIGYGYSTPKIARLTFISDKTVESHKLHIVQKLQLDNVAALRVLAIKTVGAEPSK